MRVVILVSSFLPEINGAAGNLHRRVQLLSSWGHEVLLLVPDYTKSNYYKIEDALRYQGEIMQGVKAMPYPAEQLFLSPTMLPLPRSVSRVSEKIADFKPDVIQVEGAERFIMGARELPGMTIAHKLGVPIVALHHTNYPQIAEHYSREPGFGAVLRYIPFFLTTLVLMSRWLYNNFDLTLAPSRVAVDLLRSYKVTTVEHVRFVGIDHSRFNTSLSPSTDGRLDKLGQRMRVLHVGRIDWVKRLDLLIDALQIVEQRLPGRLGLVVIGSGSAACESVVRKHATDANLLWLPFVPNESLGPYYRSCDLAVIASANETSPLVVMEAMSCGLPVVGPSAGGAGELIDHNRTGLTFSEATAASLAERLITLASDQTLMSALRSNVAKEAEAFCAEAAARRVTNRLEKLVADTRATPLSQRKESFDVQGFIFFFVFAMARLIGGLAVCLLSLRSLIRRKNV